MMDGRLPSSLRTYAYAPRTIAFQGVRSVGRWRVKDTIITVRGSAAHFPDVVDAARVTADRVLGTVPDTDRDAGVAFLTVHLGTAGVWLLLDRWEDAVILRHHHFRAPVDDPTRFVDVSDQHYGPCVWELAVQAHERQAWITHVLANPDGPNLERYLADGLSGLV